MEESKNFMDEDDTGDDETNITHKPLKSTYQPNPIIGVGRPNFGPEYGSKSSGPGIGVGRPNFGPEYGSKSSGPGIGFNRLSSGGKDSGIVYGSKYRGSEPVKGSQRPDFLGKFQGINGKTN